MARITETQLKAQLSSGEYESAYFIYGDESYLKEHYVNRFKKKIVDKTFENFNYHNFEGGISGLNEIIQSAEMLPVMSKYCLVTVHDYPFDKSEEDRKLLKDFLQDLPESSVVVFWYDSVEVDVKKNSKWKSVENLFSKSACSVCLNKKNEGELVKILTAGAKKRGKILSADNARRLISVSGTSIQVLINELEKLCHFAHSDEITKAEIEEIATKCLEARVYDLSKAIVKKDYDTAHAVLDTLFAMKEEPIVISSVISGCFVDMYRAKCAKINSMGEGDIIKAFNYGSRTFAVSNAMRDCTKLSLEALRNSIDIVNEADSKLKSTACDSKLVLEETIVKLMTAGD